MQIALVGTTNSRLRAPYDDPSWQVWAHASAHCVIPRADRWFDPHIPEVRAGVKSWDPNYQAWLAGDGRTSEIVLQAATPDVPHSLSYPREAVETWLRERGGLPAAPYFTSTVSWMLVLALYEGATRISLWGINFAQKQEYIVQRPCAEYWIGFARALGVTVDIADTSPLCRSAHVYGYDGDRADLQVPTPYAPRPLVILRDGVPRQPLMAIPDDLKLLIREQQDVLALQGV